MRNLLTLMDYSTETIEKLILDAGCIKSNKKCSGWDMTSYPYALKGKNILLYFEKPSLRTHLTFELAVHYLGGNPIYFDNSKQMGREPDIDIAKNIGRWGIDGIVARVYMQETLETFAKYSNVPVINALSNSYHPCQALADYLTIKELTSKAWKDIKLTYIGEPNNISNSLMIMAAKLGVTFTICCPASMSPDYLLLKKCQELNSNITCTCFVEDIANYDVIYCDTWFSMGDTTNSSNVYSNPNKEKILQPYQVNQELLDKLNIPFVLHCLPCHRDQEITDEVIQKHPEIYQLAENRLWTEMAVLHYLFY